MRLVLSLLLSLLIAIVSAAVICLWWGSPIPTFIVFTPILHGLMLGIGLMWIVERFGVHRTRRTVIGIVAGVVSVAALAFGQYVSDACAHQHQAQVAMRKLMPQMPTAASGGNVLANYDRDVLEPATGHRGVIGYLLLTTRHQPQWRAIVRGIEALLVIITATTLCIVARTADAPRAPPSP